jgi:hypothetical protein
MGAQDNRCATKISDSEGVEKHLDSEALWLFLDIPDIDPTNNAANRAHRFWVIWRRKRSQGTCSEKVIAG